MQLEFVGQQYQDKNTYLSLQTSDKIFEDYSFSMELIYHQIEQTEHPTKTKTHGKNEM